ncbi:hypothetical protein POTOM_034680 [Populus tomentosa]|uniref:Response regulatory domain-containing protein n=1 Tax=Populus tomentosa TaxID=118781 RepID=A0A8X7Z1N6_POPTO|nr:hypothetical protein POTOM_034680 [Populus tomentosa]
MATSNGKTRITVLIVHDDRIIKTIHSKLLGKLGIENQVTANEKKVVDLHCSGKKFDLIVMDRDMPIMNGIEEKPLTSSKVISILH